MQLGYEIENLFIGLNKESMLTKYLPLRPKIKPLDTYITTQLGPVFLRGRESRQWIKSPSVFLIIITDPPSEVVWTAQMMSLKAPLTVLSNWTLKALRLSSYLARHSGIGQTKK